MQEPSFTEVVRGFALGQFPDNTAELANNISFGDDWRVRTVEAESFDVVYAYLPKSERPSYKQLEGGDIANDSYLSPEAAEVHIVDNDTHPDKTHTLLIKDAERLSIISKRGQIVLHAVGIEVTQEEHLYQALARGDAPMVGLLSGHTRFHKSSQRTAPLHDIVSAPRASGTNIMEPQRPSMI